MSRDRRRSEYPPEERRDETASEREDDGRTLPYFVPFGWPSVFDRGDETYGAERYEGERSRPAYGGADTDRVDGDEGTWLDEGLITLLIVVGVVLFLFPEPGTSALGILLIGVGVVAWLVDWAL